MKIRTRGVYHRRTHRPGRRGRAQGIRSHQRARRRARRHGNRLPARQDSGRIDVLRAQKDDGSYPVIGVNTFRNPHGYAVAATLELARSTDEEKQGQLKRLAGFHAAHKVDAPAALAKLKALAINGGNVFAELMETVKVASLGQVTDALFEVGGQYRRSM